MGASDVTTAVPPVREALGAAGAARRWASSASSSLTARVREGWVTLHFAAARVKFPFVGDRQEIADRCISISCSAGCGSSSLAMGETATAAQSRSVNGHADENTELLPSR